MPVYNSERYLIQALNSVYAQNYSKTYLIIYDDGSTDQSKSILKSYKACYESNTHLFTHQENKGIAKAREQLIKYSFSIDPNAMIVWLDADDQFTDGNFITRFVNQMRFTQADICLFNFKIKLENEQQKFNLNGLYQEKQGHENVIDQIMQTKEQALSPEMIPDLMNISTLGWCKGYKKIRWPQPKPCAYEDFVYIAAIYQADKITALPSSYKPFLYLRRSQSQTGKRSKETFDAIFTQLKQFLKEVPKEKQKMLNQQIFAFFAA